MSGNKVSWLNVVKFAGAFIAFLIGAGFATGQEVFQYFAAYGYEGFLVGLFVLICFVYVGGDFIVAGFNEHFKNTNDIYRYYCGKYIGGFYDYFSIAFIYMSYIVMLGGAGATVNQYYHLSPVVGAILMMVLSVGTVVFGLGKIVDVIGSIGPLIVIIAIGVGLAAIVTNPGGIAEGARLIASGELDITRVGSNWFMSGTSYVGFCMLWLAAFLAAMGTKANSKKEAVIGTTLGAIGFVLGAIILMLGLLSSLQDLYTSDIPSLIIAEKIWPPLATIFSVIIIAGIYTTAVPLLWSVSARFSQEKTTKFYGLTAGLAVIACFVALELPFRKIVNVIYGVNGYVGILLIFFMLAKTCGITKKLAKQK
ncbi:hypothetical protein [Cloacibacillus sp.]|uniref:YkvI family membrane protein n=1 Tax=Cloacibacillus sp. TaxID=2049023 RepID=UPI0025BFFD08|nr:hypothetical protein [Cloacibacillus sp.]MCC8057078.1 hypothetical protein [Cloacibacillus sp.]